MVERKCFSFSFVCGRFSSIQAVITILVVTNSLQPFAQFTRDMRAALGLIASATQFSSSPPYTESITKS